MSRRSFWAAAAVVGLAGWRTAMAQTGGGPRAETIQAAARSVVQIRARGCDTEPRNGSGFVWGDAQQVVTAFHVFAGCGQISVLVNSKSIIAVPVHELVERDLAVLRLVRPVALPVLKPSPSVPQANDVLQALGFSFSVSSVDNTQLEVSSTTPTTALRNMLPDSEAEELRRSGSPELTTEILRLHGHLLPGLSGAPVIDATGRVVGIGSGGLKGGAAGVSWAISAKYLNELMRAPAAPMYKTEASRFSALFDFEEEGPRDEHRCGELTFTRSRRSTIWDLARTTDDPEGFWSFSRIGALPVQQLSGMTLEVFEEPGSGASVPVPAGSTFASAFGMCRITSADGNVAMWITSARAHAGSEAQRATVGWEEVWTNLFPSLHWTGNAATTYPTAATRESDGLVTRRKDITGYDGTKQIVKAFETLVGRGDTEVGVVVMRTTETDVDDGRARWCVTQPSGKGCVGVLRKYEFLASAVSGAYLATFPPQ